MIGGEWREKKQAQKRCPFHYRDWNAKVGSQETPVVIGKLGLAVQNEAEQRLIEFSQENTLVRANTLFQQHKRRLYTWTSPDGQYQNQIDYILCSQRLRSSTQSTRTRPGVDCGSDHELLIAKFTQLRRILRFRTHRRGCGQVLRVALLLQFHGSANCPALLQARRRFRGDPVGSAGWRPLRFFSRGVER